ncbi:MAG: hypothetical protein AAGH15_01305 [Myxococcota bacterium]
MTLRTTEIAATLFLLAGLAGCGDEDPYAALADHDGYWSALIEVPSASIEVEAINDTHVDLETRRVTVYAQNRALGMVVAPPQLGPGECAEGVDGSTVCFHPNAVYLNGSGRELDAADGTGAWWVKHSWIVDGEGYFNCAMGAAETYSCGWATGTLMDDGVTLLMEGEGGYNIRGPLLDVAPIAYQLERWSNGGTEPEFVIDFACDASRVSDFDGVARACP